MPITPSMMLQFKDEKRYCTHCNCNLEGKIYLLRKDNPICLVCHKEKFAERCEACNKPIAHDERSLHCKTRHWHEECFKCWSCQAQLSSNAFVGKDKAIYCVTCYEHQFAERCDSCNQTFKHGAQKVEYKDRRYHYPCFLCSICNKEIGNNGFVPRESDWICMPCYNEHFAHKCEKCHEVILQGGVTFKKSAYHVKCFLCTMCNIELGAMRFATKSEEDDAPYCQDCYIKRFAKLCEKCNQPIAGFGTADKFVGFNNKQWHTDCFVCAVCDKSLMNPPGFLDCEGNCVCKDCGKEM